MQFRSPSLTPAVALFAFSVLSACGDASPGAGEPEIKEGPCEAMAAAAAPDFLTRIGCRADFEALASEPLDTSIPGARSVKVVLDQRGGDALYFQNSKKYQIHYQFAAAHLSGKDGRPLVGALSDFNMSEYFLPSRRFVLGAVTYYEQPKVWALEIAPYDTASPEMIAKLYDAVAKAGYFGPALAFHPTSETIEKAAPMLPKHVRVKTSKELYEKIDYQPLNLATGVGTLRFVKAAELAKVYVSFRDIVVLDKVPNDISVVTGIITEEFQTPLSHVNVLSQSRRTPNMSLRGATSNAQLRALEGKWVRLVVGATEWKVEEVTMTEADAYWEANKPKPKILPTVDVTVKDFRNIEDVVKEDGKTPLKDLIRAQIGAFGGKAAHYSILKKTEGLPVRKAFAIPTFYYVDFMTKHGLFAMLDQMLADADFKAKPEVREARLKVFRKAMEAAPLDPAFEQMVMAKLTSEFPGLSMRFRSSANSEDLDGFTCAGCYESHTGNANDWPDTWKAIKDTWASAFLFRTFEERAYHSIDHKAVAMALLVHHNFPSEEANGVALTANPYDSSGLQPGFYVNVQFGGDAEVVHPPEGVTSDQFVHQFHQPGQPVTYLSHSSLVPAGATVLTPRQVNELGQALDLIHKRFSAAYGPMAGNTGWYAMDVEFKFDGEPGEVPKCVIKQARPHPGRGK